LTNEEQNIARAGEDGNYFIRMTIFQFEVGGMSYLIPFAAFKIYNKYCKILLPGLYFNNPFIVQMYSFIS